MQHEVRLVYVLDNGKHYDNHEIAFVEAHAEGERKALRLFAAALKLDPFRDDPGIVLITPSADGAQRVLTPVDLFEGPERWRVELPSPRIMKEEELAAVIKFSAAWPTQQNFAGPTLDGVRREAIRRAFLRAPVERDRTIAAGSGSA